VPLVGLGNDSIPAEVIAPGKKDTKEKKVIVALITTLVVVIVVAVAVILFGVLPSIKRTGAITERWDEFIGVAAEHFTVEEIGRDISSGRLSFMIEGEYSFDYACEVQPLNISTGYGPHCDIKGLGSSDSTSFLDFFMNMHSERISALLAEYSDYLVPSDGRHRDFTVNNSGKLRELFLKMMELPGMRQAYGVCKSSNLSGLCDVSVSRSIYVNVTGWGRSDIFTWAMYEAEI